MSFDAEHATLAGCYRDQLSAYRAKKVWVETMERFFLLEEGHDYLLSIRGATGTGRFELECYFITACARYAFWRLTNYQAPEAQYLIETAHIPQGESHRAEFLHAPDLKDRREEPMVLDGSPAHHSPFTRLLNRLRLLVRGL